MPRGIMIGAIGALRIGGREVMTRIAGEIVRYVMTKIQTVIAANPHQRQYKLANQDGSTDHRADQKEPRHSSLPKARDRCGIEEKLCLLFVCWQRFLPVGVSSIIRGLKSNGDKGCDDAAESFPRPLAGVSRAN